MRILLDTHVVLWLLTDDVRLSTGARALIGSRENEIYVSAASWWELAIKQSRSLTRLPLPVNEIRTEALAAGLREISVTPSHALAVLELPLLHRDPFDRMLLAQAIVEPFWLMTADAEVARYGDVSPAQVLLADAGERIRLGTVDQVVESLSVVKVDARP